MFSNIDNLDNNIIDSFNIINQGSNEYFFNINNYNFFSFNFNNPYMNNYKEEAQSKEQNYLSNKINRNNTFINDSAHKSALSLKHVINKKEKIFKIIHIKKKLKQKLNSNKENEMTMNKLFSESSNNLQIGTNIYKEDSNNSENENDNNDNSLISFFVNPISENSENRKVKHDKFSDDNLIRKTKHLVLNSVMEFINKKIYSIYDGKIGNNICKKEILSLNKKQKSNSNINYNRIFVNKKISDIFSDNISSRYSNFLPEHNKLLIEKLRKEEDENKKVYFNKLFDLTFKECLSHFNGQNNIEELEGMKRFEDIKYSIGNEEEYINVLKYNLENFENIINTKNPRRPKTNKKSKDKNS